MKTFKEMLGETVDKIKSPDEQNFVDKHVIDKKDHPVAKDDQFVAKTNKKKRKADHEDDEAVYEERMIECPDCGESYAKGDDHECDMEETVSEAEMSDAQMKKREEIVKSMKDKMGDFKKRYGDKAKDVMYATATKMAMKEEAEELAETFSKGKLTLRDRSTVTLSAQDAMALNALMGSLNDRNMEKMDQKMMKNKKGFQEILSFAREAM
jgi:hypothetical protein